ncbi:hypothetical protein V8G56_01560 [Gaetbulibacter aquiaggeris]|uniref:Outer membrane protein beta-barrel domain-containing protein n=1 Tax=Gaetbulibacter aquiaggeris TaxID=1735373 RepID=A0ABW7MKR6_9FLAO
MKDRKHIDRLFQEGFKDFEVTPKDAVWQNIEAKLNQNKKKRRILPIWWRYAGIAALFLLLLTVGSIYFNNDNSLPANQVVDTENVFPEKSIIPNNAIISSNNIAVDNNENKDPNTLSNSHNSIQSTSHSNNFSNTNLSASPIKSKDKKQILANKNSSNLNASEENNLARIDQSVSDNVMSETEIVDEKTHSNKQDISSIADNKTEESNPLMNSNAKNNSTIEEAIAESKKEVEATNLNKWSVGTHAAPIYFNSLGKGSSLDAQFNENSKSGEVTMSYGVSASYAFNKKLSIRSGINKVNLGYNTNNVIVFESIGLSSNSSALKNVDTNNSGENFSLISGESVSNIVNEPFIKTSNTSVNQSLGFIEIPLEIEYALINKKFGFNIIGGFSSFILSNNELFSEFNGNRTRIGEATNLNKVSYSANFGLGLNYKITKKLDLNLEPLFKYQINTFNNTSGNFKPYFIGVYTGIGLKF